MGKPDVQRVLDRYYDVLNRHDLDAIADVVAEDAVFDDDFLPGVVFRGPAEFRGVFELMWAAVPDEKFEILQGPYFADDADECAVHGRISGTLANAMPDMGFTRVGAAFSLEYMAMYKVSSERMSNIRVCVNPAVAVDQLSESEL
jgi:hypothetical protein